MTIALDVQGDARITGDIRYGGNLLPALTRTKLAQDNLLVYPVNFCDFRVHDAINTVLPSAGSSDDLGLYGGTFGTSQALIRTEDVKTLSKTEYARVFIRLPAEYVDGETVQISITAGAITTAADTSLDLDIEAYRVGGDNTLGSDICATAAQSINSTTFATKTFTITPGTLSAGDVLDVRVAIAVVDGSTVTAVIGAIAEFNLLCDVKG